MRFLRLVLLLVGIAQCMLAAGFFFEQTWATALWPLPETRLSYAFIAAILAGGGAPLIWIGISGKLAGLAGYGLGFGIMYVGMGIAGLLLDLREQQPALTRFAFVLGILGVIGISPFFSTRHSRSDTQQTPRMVRLAFVLEVVVLLVLLGAGLLLVLKVPNTLPWSFSPQSSVLYGWVFLGLAFYYLHAVLRPQWIHALGPLLGFLVYDLVLISPLFAHFGSPRPEQVAGQVAASAIIVFSALLGIYYLFVNPATRLGVDSSFRRNP